MGALPASDPNLVGPLIKALIGYQARVTKQRGQRQSIAEPGLSNKSCLELESSLMKEPGFLKVSP